MDNRIRQNLALMNSMSQGGMMQRLGDESIGGNAGWWKGIPCGALNFYYERKTGRILEFSNYLPSEYQDRSVFGRGTFKIAFDIKRGATPIVDFYSEEPVLLEAARIISLSIKEFNQTHGF